MCVCECARVVGGGGGAGGRKEGRREYRTKNKNPTRQCAEKALAKEKVKGMFEKIHLRQQLDTIVYPHKLKDRIALQDNFCQ